MKGPSRHPWRRWTDAERQTLTTMHLAGASDAEIGAALGRTAQGVKDQRQQLGFVTWHRRPWTEEDSIQLLALLEEHTPWQEICRIMNRHESFIQEKAVERGSNFRDQPGHYSLNGAMRLLGVDCTIVRCWIKTGRLKATRVPQRHPRNMWTFIEHDDLVEFLACEDNWHLYKPERIADLALREWTTEIRGDVRFMTCTQAAPLLHMSPLSVQKVAREGRIWAVQQSTRHSNWLLRSDRLTVAPRRMPAARKPPFTSADLATIRRWWGIRPVAWIARRLGYSATAVWAAGRRLGLPLIGRGHWKRVKGGKAHG